MSDQNTQAQPIPFDNSYVRLPDHFHARRLPTPVAKPSLVRLNESLAAELGLNIDWLKSPSGLAMLAGTEMPAGADPIAMAYAGHQFGNFVPQLGDGRAILLGEVIDSDGRRRDIQLKGSGRTPFSRGGDGRAALGPVLREYIVSEAFAALGIPTTRALAAVATGEPVFRETALPGAILTRVASSHIRVGTFQYFAARGDIDAIRRLADYVIDRHYPDAMEAENRYLAMFKAVLARQAGLIARWMHVGFIHGVMNTDNMSIAGETIDFGPCAFLDAFGATKVFSSIDRMGRYAYANQPKIAQWNLARLAETLLALFSDDETSALKHGQDAIETFPAVFEAAYIEGARAKLGLSTPASGDLELHNQLLAMMQTAQADYTNTFQLLTAIAADRADDEDFITLVSDRTTATDWLSAWRMHIATDTPGDATRIDKMRRANPVIIPRNHRIEEAIGAASMDGDFSYFNRLVNALAEPLRDRPDIKDLKQPPSEAEEVRQTYCGT